MSDNTKPPIWFWIVSIAMLIWNLMGVAAYLANAYASPEDIAAMPEEQQMMLETRPAWVMAAFATAVFAGTAGCLALVLKKGFASPLLILSLLAVFAQDTYWFFFSDMISLASTMNLVMTFLVIVIAIFLVWFANMSRKRGWIT